MLVDDFVLLLDIKSFFRPHLADVRLLVVVVLLVVGPDRFRVGVLHKTVGLPLPLGSLFGRVLGEGRGVQVSALFCPKVSAEFSRAVLLVHNWVRNSCG